MATSSGMELVRFTLRVMSGTTGWNSIFEIAESYDKNAGQAHVDQRKKQKRLIGDVGVLPRLGDDGVDVDDRNGSNEWRGLQLQYGLAVQRRQGAVDGAWQPDAAKQRPAAHAVGAGGFELAGG